MEPMYVIMALISAFISDSQSIVESKDFGYHTDQDGLMFGQPFQARVGCSSAMGARIALKSYSINHGQRQLSLGTTMSSSSKQSKMDREI